MFFKKRDDEGLPDLPSSGYLRMGPPEGDDEGENHTLPSFPDSPAHNKFSQAAIKDAVSDKNDGDDGEMMEMNEWHPSQLPENEFGKIDDKLKSQFSKKNFDVIEDFKKDFSQTDVFVKIDRFRTARRALYDVREKLDEIDELIKKIKETKLREEQEFSFWERELATIKSRIGEVTENIFEKAD